MVRKRAIRAEQAEAADDESRWSVVMGRIKRSNRRRRECQRRFLSNAQRLVRRPGGTTERRQLRIRGVDAPERVIEVEAIRLPADIIPEGGDAIARARGCLRRRGAFCWRARADRRYIRSIGAVDRLREATHCDRYATGRWPIRGGHAAMRPRCTDCSTVCVNVLIDT